MSRPMVLRRHRLPDGRIHRSLRRTRSGFRPVSLPTAEDEASLAVAEAQAVRAEAPERPSSRRLAALLVAGALVSKLLGFVREILMAQVLGASLVADGFRGAMTAILLPLSLLQNESVPAILIPMHRDWQKSGDAPRRLAALTAALTLIAFGLMVAVQALGLYWVEAIVGGFDSAGQALTLEFVRIMALGMPAAVMVNSLAAAEIAMGRSRLTTLRASNLNVAVLAGLGILAWTGRFDGLAWAFTVAFNTLGAWGLWRLWREGQFDPAGLRPRLILAGGAEFLRRLRPLLALPVAEQGNVWIERVMASRLVTGTVASMDYARTITDSAILLISQPLGLAVMSREPSKDVPGEVARIARPILAAALPVSVFLMLFAPEVARIVFSRGAFNEHAVLLSSQALRGIAAGLWAATLGWILLRMLNSSGRNAAAALILSLSFGANVGFNLLTWHLQETSGAGPLLFGFGEALRGLVLLAGTVLMLGCAGRMLRLTAIAAIPAGLMALAGWQIHVGLAGTLERLLAGSVACAACVALGAALLLPETCRMLLARGRARLLSILSQAR